MDLDQIFYRPPRKFKGRFRFNKSPAPNLEPEEIFLDAQRDQTEKMEIPIKKRNFIILFLTVSIIFFGFLVKTAWLQIINYNSYKSHAEKNRIRIIPLIAPRGIIYDRNGRQLVYNVPSFDLVATPAFFSKDQQEREKILKRVAEILGEDLNDIKQLLQKSDNFSFEPIVLKANLEREKVLIFEEEIKKLPGISLERNLQREYPLAQAFSHLLGYIGRVSSQDLREHPDYFPSEMIGKSGIEAEYEEVLRTLPGKKEIEVDAFGRILKETNFESTAEPHGLILSIDADLQEYIFKSLITATKETKSAKAAAIALDPRNGKVLALVSLPSFDNNLLVRGVSQSEYSKLIDNPDQPLFNRTISGQYPAGSTIKPFIGAAALEEGIIKEHQIIIDRGPLHITNRYNPDIVYTFPDWKVHGPVDIYSAIAQSCNIFFYYLGGGYGSFPGLGIEKLEKYLKLFGFGQLTNIDLGGEKEGLVPNEQWKKDNKQEEWFIGDTYHLSIGQGDLKVTPLQIAVLTAAIANGGTIWQPQVVDKIIDSEKNIIKDIEPKARKIDFISAKNLAIIRNAMRQTIVAGSAQQLKSLLVAVAGKTGTAQTSKGKKPHAWFTSFAPFEKPELVLTILIEEGGEGSSVAVPVARDVFQWYFTK